jgi:hypothetical protein
MRSFLDEPHNVVLDGLHHQLVGGLLDGLFFQFTDIFNAKIQWFTQPDGLKVSIWHHFVRVTVISALSQPEETPHFRA